MNAHLKNPFEKMYVLGVKVLKSSEPKWDAVSNPNELQFKWSRIHFPQDHFACAVSTPFSPARLCSRGHASLRIWHQPPFFLCVDTDSLGCPICDGGLIIHLSNCILPPCISMYLLSHWILASVPGGHCSHILSCL